MIFVRKALDFVFTKDELRVLDTVIPPFRKSQKKDDSTNNNEVVYFYLKKSFMLIVSFLKAGGNGIPAQRTSQRTTFVGQKEFFSQHKR